MRLGRRLPGGVSRRNDQSSCCLLLRAVARLSCPFSNELQAFCFGGAGSGMNRAVTAGLKPWALPGALHTLRTALWPATGRVSAPGRNVFGNHGPRSHHETCCKTDNRESVQSRQFVPESPTPTLLSCS